MLSGVTILSALMVLAGLVQWRRRRLPHPPPLVSRIRVRARRCANEVHVEFLGARGLALSFHDASWEPEVDVTDASGPLTLVSSADVRSYRLATARRDVLLVGVWEQLTFARLALSVDLEQGRITPAPSHRSASRSRVDRPA
ncbi:uncharacterized protein (TIGR03382 family) [Tenggerimyces flavus]|nr:uncharacterized protein (TIGR03382 family) [Tenggerimyces flavus]